MSIIKMCIMAIPYESEDKCDKFEGEESQEYSDLDLCTFNYDMDQCQFRNPVDIKCNAQVEKEVKWSWLGSRTLWFQGVYFLKDDVKYLISKDKYYSYSDVSFKIKRIMIQYTYSKNKSKIQEISTQSMVSYLHIDDVTNIQVKIYFEGPYSKLSIQSNLSNKSDVSYSITDKSTGSEYKCDEQDPEVYINYNTTVLLKANYNNDKYRIQGFIFDGKSHGTQDDTCEIEMDNDKSVNVTFLNNKYVLTCIASPSTSTLNKNPIKSSYDYGDAVTLTAGAAPSGYYFNGIYKLIDS